MTWFENHVEFNSVFLVALAAIPGKVDPVLLYALAQEFESELDGPLTRGQLAEAMTLYFFRRDVSGGADESFVLDFMGDNESEHHWIRDICLARLRQDDVSKVLGFLLNDFTPRRKVVGRGFGPE